MNTLATLKRLGCRLKSSATTSIVSFGRYLRRVLIAADRLLNTILGGMTTDTLSARMGKDIASGRCKWCKVFCRVLDWFDKDHCKESADR